MLTDRQTLRRSTRWYGVAFLAGTVLAVVTADQRTSRLLVTTLKLGLGSAMLSVPMGTALAWVITRTNAPGRRWMQGSLGILLFMPLLLHTAAWDAGFGMQGWFHALMAHWNVPPLLSGWRGAIWVHATSAVPWVTLIVAVGLRSIASQWEDAAIMETNPLRVFLYIGLPYSLGAMTIAVFWVLLTVAGEITVTDVFQIRTIAEELYIGYAQNPVIADSSTLVPLDMTGIEQLGMTLWLALGGMAVCTHFMAVHGPVVNSHPKQFDLGRYRPLASAFLWFALVVLVAVPLGNLVMKLGLTVQQVSDHRVRRWSLHQAVSLLVQAPVSFRHELGWTLLLAQMTALSSVVIGGVLAWVATVVPRGRPVIVMLLAVGFAIPGPTLALALIRLMNQPDSLLLQSMYDRSLVAPWIGMTTRVLPIVTLVLWNAFHSVPRDQFDSARLAGAGMWRQLITIGVPQHRYAFAAAWFIAIAIASGELTTSILLVPPGVTTLSIRIFGLVHYGVEDQLAALCLVTIAAVAAVAMIPVLLSKRLFSPAER